MKLYIKYMVSLRCKIMVKNEIEKLGLKCENVELGVATLNGDITAAQRAQLCESLKNVGLELIDDRKTILIEKIKGVIIEMIHNAEEMPGVNYSDYISEKLNYDYTYLSNIFSEVKKMNIQQYIITHKIEKVKELLLYNELTLTEIAHKLQYSSVAHLSNQFKKVTGLSASTYKTTRHRRERLLETV